MFINLCKKFLIDLWIICSYNFCRCGFCKRITVSVLQNHLSKYKPNFCLISYWFNIYIGINYNRFIMNLSGQQHNMRLHRKRMRHKLKMPQVLKILLQHVFCSNIFSYSIFQILYILIQVHILEL